MDSQLNARKGLFCPNIDQKSPFHAFATDHKRPPTPDSWKDEIFPADLVILETSFDETGHCYIDTKNLDGETN